MAAGSSSYSANAVEPPPRTAADGTKYKGVRKRKWGKYVSEIRLPNSRERIWLGSYDTAEKAARAFDVALFCLRGPHAKFNFHDDPPDIPGGQSLSPAEILVVAQQYGNSYGGSSSYHSPPPQARAVALDNSSQVDLIDCSFWDMVDSNGGGQNAGAGVSDFGFFPEAGDMYMTPHFDPRDHDQDEDDYNYHHGNAPSFLWNF